MITEFPHSGWQPTAGEYFRACAPDGKILHGSSTMKRFQFSPRVYRDQMGALAAQEIERRGGLPMSDLAREIIEDMGGKRCMDFGSAVEVAAFDSEEHMPAAMAGARKRLARLRAEQIRCHEETAAYMDAPGSALQVAHRWQDEASGLWFRLRFDCCYWSKETPHVLDLKIWSRVTARNLKYKVRDNGADIQAAIYRRGAISLWDEKPPHTLAIADPSVSGKIFVRTLPEEMIEEADERLSRLADQLAECYRTGNFTDEEERNQEL